MRLLPNQISTSESPVKTKIRATGRFLKLHRIAFWEREVNGDKKDMYRKFRSQEMSQEDIQDFSSNMGIIGSNVISLYPNLDVNAVSREMKTASLGSKIDRQCRFPRSFKIHRIKLG